MQCFKCIVPKRNNVFRDIIVFSVSGMKHTTTNHHHNQACNTLVYFQMSFMHVFKNILFTKCRCFLCVSLFTVASQRLSAKFVARCSWPRRHGGPECNLFSTARSVNLRYIPHSIKHFLSQIFFKKIHCSCSVWICNLRQTLAFSGEVENRTHRGQIQCWAHVRRCVRDCDSWKMFLPHLS